ncbi:class I SAM-dependent methyltransferase [Lysobacter sp. S4-A87]|uniref:methyltransferase regulatory domain-containing protein n=1 Tax=Lysobacter sp. S4-A87 TaxID=2925843 RepID=UPI001F52FF54|nr:methyltransferase regulatory domain-containing protein [Lysobacter sp. S4-A87]UNK49927.1 class I SAM-dependent methyltransferase [Lysobacter sp. S4-A87]
MTTLTERIGKTYDKLPYLSAAFPVTAPEHLRTVAYLFGLDAPEPEWARVLELGCAAGGNVIPFAARYPNAQVTGVDLSQVQVEAGQRAIAEMGLDNLRLVQASISDLGSSLGEFDYIICHGVYSWVPPEVQDAILGVSRQCLSANGIAHVSYNTYPGWKAKEVVRDAMLLRADGRSDAERLDYARGMIDFLHEMAPADSVLAKIMEDNSQTIRHGREYYLAHEFLELCNSPCYFRDFLASARRHGLEYLAEALPSAMFASNYGAQQAQMLLAECEGDQVRLEQLIDFLSNRTFRQTLLVHPANTDGIRYQLDATRISRLHVAAIFKPASDDGTTWSTSKGQTITAASPMAQAAVAALNKAWPGSVPVATLVNVAQTVAGDQDLGKDQLISFLSALIVANAVHFRLDPMQLDPEVEARPKVRPALRKLAGMGSSAPVQLFNEWHQSIEPSLTAAFVLSLLDGRRDRAALTAALVAAVADQQFTFKRDDKVLDDPQEIARSAEDAVTEALEWLSNNAMLVGKTP